MRQLILLSIIAITLSAAAAAQADVPNSMNIQGRLTDTAGASIGERFMEFGFTIWDAPIGGVLIWSGESQELYVDLSGLWNARIGASNPLTEAVFADTSRWLEILVGDSANLPDTLPRIKLNTTPYTYRAASSQQADVAALALSVADNSVTSASIQDGSIGFVDIGQNGADTGQMMKWDGDAWITASDEVGAQDSDWVLVDSVLWTGGHWGIARGNAGNTISPTVAHNSVNLGLWSEVSDSAYEFGGFGTISGGRYNLVASDDATVGGGLDNKALGDNATVSGGQSGTAAEWGTVGGGYNNSAGQFAVVAGGWDNSATGSAAAVGGGHENTASGEQATVPGGLSNTAAGNYSFAAGLSANASHAGSFVWSDASAGGFTSTGVNQFLIKAGGGVGIGVDSPSATLEVGGIIHSNSGGIRFPDGSLQSSAYLSRWKVQDSVLYTDSLWGIARGGAGNILYDPAQRTHVNFGIASRTGNSYHDATFRGEYATVGGGHENWCAANSGTISGGSGNWIGGTCTGATISGGEENGMGTGYFNVIGGGKDNFIPDDAYGETIGGGINNTAAGNGNVVGGGGNNTSFGPHNTVSGGENNQIGYSALPSQASYCSIGGGRDHLIEGYSCTIAGGSHNRVRSSFCTIGGGADNTAGDTVTVAELRGTHATVGGGSLNNSRGDHATIPGGSMNGAFGGLSFAAGHRAKADSAGSFVWADSSDFDFHCDTVNQFAVRSTGGARFVSAIDGSGNPTNGVRLAAGAGAWATASDSALKENVEAVDGADVLERLAALPINEWNYESQSETIRHIGPMAQDFHRLFGLGKDDKTISTIDPSGIALAAIKELYRQNQQLKAANEELRRRVEAVEGR